MKKRLLVLGAAQTMIPAISVAKRMEIEIIITDRNPNAPGLALVDKHETVDITDTEGILRIAEKYRVDGVLPLNDFGVPTAAKVCARLGLPGVRVETAKNATHKAFMRQVWSRENLPQPNFEILEASNCYKPQGETKYPCVLKPAISGGGSRGAILVRNSSELKKNLDFSLEYSKDGTLILEEYVEGVEHMVDSLTWKGKTTVLGLSDTTCFDLPDYFIEGCHIYPSNIPRKLNSKISEIITKAVKAVGIKEGPSHCELITVDGEVKLLEIGARVGAGGSIASLIIPHTSGVNMMEETIKISLGMEPSIHPHKGGGSVMKFFNLKPGKVKHISGTEKIQEKEGLVFFYLSVKKGDEIKKMTSGLQRVGGFIVLAPTRKEAIRRANLIDETVEIQVH